MDAELSVSSATVADAAYARLKSAIISGAFRPDDELKERELVLRMGISRTPVREALQRLALEGMIWSAPHRGARVRRLDLKEARELFELRHALEGRSSELAARRAGRDAAEALRADAQGTTREDGPTARSLLLNHKFHTGLAALAGNRRLADAIGHALDLISLWRLGAIGERAVWRDTAEEHGAILDAVAEGDAPDARRLMEAHVDASWEASVAATKNG